MSHNVYTGQQDSIDTSHNVYTWQQHRTIWMCPAMCARGNFAGRTRVPSIAHTRQQ